MSTVEHLTTATFDAAIARPGIAVIDFWAAWCGPCRAMAPPFEKAAAQRSDCTFAKVDVDAEPAIAGRYGIQSIRTLMVLRDGEPIAAQAGVISARALVEALDRIATAEQREPATARLARVPRMSSEIRSGAGA
ncbi:MAG: thioredoxin family protein [Solirubrobacteraceae bacterium]|jgi:thioredoxin 1